MADLQLLKRLCETRGISGREEAVRNIILEEISSVADSVEVDALGNLIAYKRGKERPKTKLMLSAHMDEVGLIVTYITEDGLLKFAEVGGIDRRVLCGKAVIVGDNLPGIIGATPIHLLKSSEREKSVPVEELSIDIGAKNREEAQKVVSLGDPITFCSYFDLSSGMVRGKAIDDRAGCALLIDILKQDLPYDMFFTFVVQEEVGLRGAQTAAYQVDPQAAIVVESTTAADIFGVEDGKKVCFVGKGPVLSFMDRRTIYDREYFLWAQSIGKQKGIPYQVKQAVAGGNDAGAIHKSRGGVRTIAVSLACRYLHAPAGCISQEDLQHTELLIQALAEKIAGTGQKI